MQPPIKTFGLTHLDLAVHDPERSMAFYAAVFGLEEYVRPADGIVAVTPGTHDLISFKRAPERAGQPGGMAHFGFRLQRAQDMDEVLQRAEAAGATILRRGEVGPGKPYAALHDLDGYEVEIYAYTAEAEPATVK